MLLINYFGKNKEILVRKQKNLSSRVEIEEPLYRNKYMQFVNIKQ
jgi:hypothetical protein